MTPRDIWIRIATFVAVTYAFSSIFMYMVISSGEITALTAFGGMWSPFVGVLVTRLIFPDGRRRGSLAGLGWGWGKTRYQVMSYVLPILYVLATYVVVWLTDVGRFTDAAPGTVAMWALKNVGTGFVTATIFAFGEEVGWQGFLVPQLYRITDFTKTALLRGIIWSVWHYPLLLGGVYGTQDTPAWFRLVCFTITMTGISFAFAWLRLKSGSLWTGMWMHASHNKFIQSIFPGVTVGVGAIAWYVDEMGALTAVAAVVVAFVFWRKRGEFPAPEPL